jgi:hypothetical protein
VETKHFGHVERHAASSRTRGGAQAGDSTRSLEGRLNHQRCAEACSHECEKYRACKVEYFQKGRTLAPHSVLTGDAMVEVVSKIMTGAHDAAENYKRKARKRRDDRNVPVRQICAERLSNRPEQTDQWVR